MSEIRKEIIYIIIQCVVILSIFQYKNFNNKVLGFCFICQICIIDLGKLFIPLRYISFSFFFQLKYLFLLFSLIIIFLDIGKYLSFSLYILNFKNCSCFLIFFFVMLFLIFIYYAGRFFIISCKV